MRCTGLCPLQSCRLWGPMQQEHQEDCASQLAASYRFQRVWAVVFTCGLQAMLIAGSYERFLFGLECGSEQVCPYLIHARKELHWL